MERQLLKFKKIKPIDYGKLLYEMDIKTFTREYDYPSPSEAMTLSYLKNCEVYFVYHKNTLVGLFAFEEKDGKVEVKQIAVLPEFQNKGYGKIIVKKLLQINKGKNIWLVTHPKNIIAIVLYLKNGFNITGWKDDYYGDGQPRMILQYN